MVFNNTVMTTTISAYCDTPNLKYQKINQVWISRLGKNHEKIISGKIIVVSIIYFVTPKQYRIFYELVLSVTSYCHFCSKCKIPGVSSCGLNSNFSFYF